MLHPSRFPFLLFLLAGCLALAVAGGEAVTAQPASPQLEGCWVVDLEKMAGEMGGALAGMVKAIQKTDKERIEYQSWCAYYYDTTQEGLEALARQRLEKSLRILSWVGLCFREGGKVSQYPVEARFDTPEFLGLFRLDGRWSRVDGGIEIRDLTSGQRPVTYRLLGDWIVRDLSSTQSGFARVFYRKVPPGGLFVKGSVAEKASKEGSLGMGPLLESVCRKLGPTPREYPIERSLAHRQFPPDSDANLTSFTVFYRDQDLLFREGEVAWGALLQANRLLFNPGLGDHPAAAVFSADTRFDNDLKSLVSTASSLYRLKGRLFVNRELAELVHAITNERILFFNRRLPVSFTKGPEIYCTSIMVHRTSLPLGLLAESCFPILVLPGKTQTSIIVPCEYWPDALQHLWAGNRRW